MQLDENFNQDLLPDRYKSAIRKVTLMLDNSGEMPDAPLYVQVYTNDAMASLECEYIDHDGDTDVMTKEEIVKSCCLLACNPDVTSFFICFPAMSAEVENGELLDIMHSLDDSNPVAKEIKAALEEKKHNLQVDADDMIRLLKSLEDRMQILATVFAVWFDRSGDNYAGITSVTDSSSETPVEWRPWSFAKVASSDLDTPKLPIANPFDKAARLQERYKELRS